MPNSEAELSTEEPEYNKRLFTGGLRRRVHLARFTWLERTARRVGVDTSNTLELGCFDGRSLSHLPREPEFYTGVDADWEGGLSAARRRFRGMDSYTFHESRSLESLPGLETPATLALCLETIEHLPPDDVLGYLDYLQENCRGHLLVTVPVELGPAFLAKYTYKAVKGHAEEYTATEILNATIGRTGAVKRNEHKGFDYRSVIREVQQRFELIGAENISSRLLPRWLGIGVGIVACTR